MENLASLTPVKYEIGPDGPWASREGGTPGAGGGEPAAVRLRTRGPDLELTLTDDPPAEPVRTAPGAPADPPPGDS